MNTKIRHTLRMGAPLLLAVAALLLGVAALNIGTMALAAPGGAPASAPQAAIDNEAVCTVITGSVTCDLYAITGTLALPGGASAPIWGYSDTAGGAAQLPGPTIIATEGDSVSITLHNNLAEDTALIFPGQAIIPDLTGAAANGGIQTYIFTATNPGTYLYEAGLLPDAARQVAMGMFGALVVRPASGANHAYNASSAFDVEALVLLSEIDPALNADPSGFDMRDFWPQYRLINGKAYPETAEITATAGNRVLLRYVNAGIQQHTMGLLGVGQELIARDGSLRPYPQRELAESIGPGRTADAIVTVPAATLDGIRLALYDTSLLLHNNGAAGFGGMLTFLNVSAAGPGNGEAPNTSNVVVAPNSTNGLVDVTVTATVMSTAPYTVTAAEFFIDVRGADGTGTVMTATDTVFDTDNEGVTATILAADVAALSAGTHTIYVHGQDSNNVWGPFATAILTVDKSGPTISSVMLAPNPTDEQVAVVVTATMTTAATAAEFYVDATTGMTPTMMMSQVAGVWTGTISATSTVPADVTLATLASGDHTIYVRGQNAAGIWGAFNFAVLHLDKLGPTTSGITLAPNPSDGSVDVFVSATGNDSAMGNSNIAAAEYFTDATGTDGTGTLMAVSPIAPIASLDGVISPTMLALPEGAHTVYVHSMDAFSQWGDHATATLKVDTTGPETGDVVADPNPNNGSLPYNPTVFAVRVDATFTDTLTGINGGVNSAILQAEGFISPTVEVADYGTGFPLTPRDGLFNETVEDAYVYIPLSTISPLGVGSHSIWIHGQDASGNWGAAVSVDLVIETDSPTVSGTTVDPVSTDGTILVTLTATATDASSNIVLAEWFAGVDPGTGNGTAMDAFDGAFDSPTEVLTATVDASGWAAADYPISVRARDAAGNWSPTDSTILTVTVTGEPPTGPELLYFSTAGNAAVPGVPGRNDDADVYLWNATLFSRVLDGTADGGLPGNADIDALAFDAGVFYLSFNRNGGTNVPSPAGGVFVAQDEDVVLYDSENGEWELFFAGVDVCDGMDASNDHDIDAFDVDLVTGFSYFSTVGNAVVSGAGGPYDDADIYRAGGGAGCSRVFDASAAGLLPDADIDGLTVVDADTFYVSFVEDTDILGFEVVQDEDVVLYDAGVWSMHFDGTAQGLDASNNHDLDAIDVQ